MQKQLLTFAVTTLLFFNSVAFASAPPVIPADKLAPVVAPGPNPPLVPPPTGGVPGLPPFSLQTIKNCMLSGVVCEGILSALTRGTGPASTSPSSIQTDSAPAYSVVPDAAPALPPANATADALQDAEPAVISITAGGVDTTITTSFKYEGGANPWLNYARTTNFTTFDRLRMPTSAYTFSGDPLMDVNPFNGGVGALRMYCVAITYNNLAAPETAPNAIALWHADQPDYTFTATPTIVDSRFSSQTSRIFLDKPAMAVSWHNGTDLGYIYTAYVSADFTNGNTAILVSRSTDGGANFSAPTVIAYGGRPDPPNDQPIQTVQNPQIIVSPGSGAVYVLWVNFGSNDIRMSRSTDFGATWGPHEIAATGTMATSRTVVTGLSRAVTAPMARYDSVANSIILTWHDVTGNGLDVEYAWKDINGWHRPAQSVVQFTANDQFFPALDFNRSGNVVITYYDRHADATNNVYRPYQNYMTSGGTRIDAVDHDMAGFDSDPRTSNRFIGDYQTVWDWTFIDAERATGSWIGIVNTTFDNYLSRISY